MFIFSHIIFCIYLCSDRTVIALVNLIQNLSEAWIWASFWIHNIVSALFPDLEIDTHFQYILYHVNKFFLFSINSFINWNDESNSFTSTIFILFFNFKRLETYFHIENFTTVHFLLFFQYQIITRWRENIGLENKLWNGLINIQ